jgi:hypothetical protein
MNMNKIALVLIHVFCAAILLSAACSDSKNTRLQGAWKTGNGAMGLKITNTQFTLLNDSPEPEDYFMKGDTIFTSFQGSIPYSKFIVKQLDDHHLNLVGPDSVMMVYSR